ncbi:DUF5995 family protein, partial [Streptomyces alkaliterrae]
GGGSYGCSFGGAHNRRHSPVRGVLAPPDPHARAGAGTLLGMESAQRTVLRPQVPPQVPVSTEASTHPSPWPSRLTARLRTAGPVRAAPVDGVAVFHRLYLSAATGFGGGPEPDRPPGTDDLAVRLADRYLGALAAAQAGLRPPACWRPLFRLRHHPGVRPSQFALAGVSAHLAHDLPLALLEAATARGVGPEALEADLDGLAGLLEGLEEAVGERVRAELSSVADPLAYLVGGRSAARAREAAWSAFRMLWRLGEAPALPGEFTARLGAEAQSAARLLLTPLRPPTAAAPRPEKGEGRRHGGG